MLSFSVQAGDEITCAGVHTNEANDPVEFAFTRTHPLGTARAVITADLDAHLIAEGRTGTGADGSELGSE